MTPLTVLPVFSNAQAGKELRHAVHVFFSAELIQLEDSTWAENVTLFNCFKASRLLLWGDHGDYSQPELLSLPNVSTYNSGAGTIGKLCRMNAGSR